MHIPSKKPHGCSCQTLLRQKILVSAFSSLHVLSHNLEHSLLRRQTNPKIRDRVNLDEIPSEAAIEL